MHRRVGRLAQRPVEVVDQPVPAGRLLVDEQREEELPVRPDEPAQEPEHRDVVVRGEVRDHREHADHIELSERPRASPRPRRTVVRSCCRARCARRDARTRGGGRSRSRPGTRSSRGTRRHRRSGVPGALDSRSPARIARRIRSRERRDRRGRSPRDARTCGRSTRPRCRSRASRCGGPRWSRRCGRTRRGRAARSGCSRFAPGAHDERADAKDRDTGHDRDDHCGRVARRRTRVVGGLGGLGGRRGRGVGDRLDLAVPGEDRSAASRRTTSASGRWRRGRSPAAGARSTLCFPAARTTHGTRYWPVFVVVLPWLSVTRYLIVSLATKVHWGRPAGGFPVVSVP